MLLLNKEDLIMNTEVKVNDIITPEQYEILQPQFDCKTEFSDGKIIMHSDVSDKHNLITTRLVAELIPFFRKRKCRVRSEKIEIIFDEQHKFKPDVFVACGEIEMQGQSYLTSPTLVFEVISKSTAPHDKVTKFNIYMKYGVKEYCLVEQTGFITQYSLIDGWYEQTGAFRVGDVYKSTAIEGLEFEVENIFEEE